MTAKHIRVTVVTAMIVGAFVLGRWTREQPHRPSSRANHDRAAAPVVAGKTASAPLRRRWRPETRTNTPASVPPSERSSAAKARLAILREQIQTLQAELLFQQGKPLDFPDDLDDRFRQKAVVESINQALVYAGIKAEVDTIDCNEYPCIACATLPSQHGDVPDVNHDLAMLNRAAQSPSVEPYKDAEKAATVVTKKEAKDGRPMHTTTFCQSFFAKAKPGDEHQTSQIKKRIRFRMKDLLDTGSSG